MLPRTAALTTLLLASLLPSPAFAGESEEPTVKALLATARKDRDIAKRTAALEALTERRDSAKEVASSLLQLVALEARLAGRTRLKIRIDPATGDPDLKTDEGRRVIEELRARNAMRAAAVRCVLRLGLGGRLKVEALHPFLRSGSDDLVAVTLEVLAKKKDWSALPRILALFQMYPHELAWDLPDVKTRKPNAAKGFWMTVYGDPDLERARPKVVKAVKTTLEAITGEKIGHPDALKAFLKRKDVKRKIKAAKR